jgi:hypothetical protein
VINADALEGETHKAVERGNDEGKSGLLGDLSENLVLDTSTGNGNSVLREEAGNLTGAVLDGELLTVGNVGGRLGGVILGVEIATKLVDRALGAGDLNEPEKKKWKTWGSIFFHVRRGMEVLYSDWKYMVS